MKKINLNYRKHWNDILSDNQFYNFYIKIQGLIN